MEVTIPYDQNGQALVAGQRPVNGQDTDAAQINVPLADIQSMLSQVLLKSGVAPMVGSLNMNSFKIVGVGDATNNSDAVNLAQLNLAKQKFATKSSDYNLSNADFNTVLQFIGNLDVTMSDAISADWFAEAWAATGTVTITPTIPQTINGQASLTLTKGQSARIFKTGATTFVASISGGVWSSKAIGEIYMVETGITGVDIPPVTASDVTYVQLTAGLTGAGQFNEGKLTGETNTGSAPLVSATAVISVTGSPMNGRTIRLLNTESRILRPSTSSGALQNDAMQNISGTLRLNKTSTSVANGPFDAGDISGAAETGQSGNGTNITFDASRVVRTATETRMKNLGVTAYMRVK
jgi:hypothetical protein